MSEKVNRSLLLKSGFWYVVSSFLTKAMVFITMPIYTRLMSKEEYGDFSVFASWQAILVIVCGLEIYSTLNRARFDFTEEDALDSYITSSLTLSTLFTGVLFLFYLIFPHIFDRLFLLDRKYMFIMFAYLFALPAFSMFQMKQRVTYKYKLSAAISFGLSMASAILAVVLTITLKDNRLLGRIIGQYGLLIVAGMIFYAYFVLKNHVVKLSNWKYALRIGLPLVFSYVGSQLLLTSDALVLKHMCSSEEVSYISVAHTASHTIILLTQTLNAAWGPWFYDMLKLGENREIKKTFQMYLWASIACTFAVLLIGPEIILVLGGPKYHESIYLLPPCILCGVFTVLTAQFGSLETYHKKPEYAAVLTGIVALMNIVLNIAGVSLWGYAAVCYTTVFCHLILIMLHYAATKDMSIRELLPLRDLLPALGAALLLVPIALILYKKDLLRYTTIGVCFVILIVVFALKRKQIAEMVADFRKKSRSGAEA